MFSFYVSLCSKITVDLTMNRMECFFGMVDSPAELAGSYSMQTNEQFNFSFRISSQKDNNIFESNKTSDQFVVPAIHAGVYRLCFTSLRILSKEEKEADGNKTVEAKLTFEYNQLKAEKSSSDKLGLVLNSIDTSVSKIQSEYRSVRMNEQELQRNTAQAKRRMWIMFFIEVGCIAAAVGFQTVYITRLHKRV
ncbi:EMP24/GP25L/P24_family protein [Hexamita inflata]|uniref:EMP24/GP25L/P24_family protein n=1 Tax=Hexamita inflata TaxID=28002 RepID=A0ABP1L281_9EUKA